MQTWEKSADGVFEVCTVRDGPSRTPIATVRDTRTKAVVATVTPSAVSYHVPSSDALKTAVEAALSGYRAALTYQGA